MHQQDLHRRNAHGSNPQPPPVGSGGRQAGRLVAQDAAKAILFGDNAWVQMESGGSAPLGRLVLLEARNQERHADQQSAESRHQRDPPRDAKPNFAQVRAHTGFDRRCRNHGRALIPANETGHASADATNEGPFLPPVPNNKWALTNAVCCL